MGISSKSNVLYYPISFAYGLEYSHDHMLVLIYELAYSSYIMVDIWLGLSYLVYHMFDRFIDMSRVRVTV